MTISRFIGVALAWREGDGVRSANETGLVVLDQGGRVLDAGWTRGIGETVAWIRSRAGAESALLLVDAPLVVSNPTGQRPCETQVGQRYGRWKVSANTTNTRSRRLGGVALRKSLEAERWHYSDGFQGPPKGGHFLSECYPYTTLVGATELGYDVERPRYKRKPRIVTSAQFRPMRAAICDQLIARLLQLENADPPLLLCSHPVTRRLVAELSPTTDREYKHREDLIDALLCAWTAALWVRHGLDRCQVLGEPSLDSNQQSATIIAPTRPEQRR